VLEAWSCGPPIGLQAIAAAQDDIILQLPGMDEAAAAALLCSMQALPLSSALQVCLTQPSRRAGPCRGNEFTSHMWQQQCLCTLSCYTSGLPWFLRRPRWQGHDCDHTST
jgi:hypothetical protein